MATPTTASGGSVGRAAKAAKEDIVGLIVALEDYMLGDHDADTALWRGQAEWMLSQLTDFPGVTVSYLHDGREHPVPRVQLVLEPETSINAHDLVLALEEHDPRVFSSNHPARAPGPTAS